MQNRKLFCFGIHDEVLNNIKKLNYIPVGLGENTVSEGWLKDNSGDNISHKNKFYSELTFYYWLWKNKFHEISQNEWIGFCQYRRHWKKNRDKSEKNYLSNQVQEFLFVFHVDQHKLREEQSESQFLEQVQEMSSLLKNQWLQQLEQAFQSKKQVATW